MNIIYFAKYSKTGRTSAQLASTALGHYQAIVKSHGFNNRLIIDRFIDVSEIDELASPDIYIDENKKGRIKSGCFHYNISHSGEIWALAASRVNVGLDVQCVKSIAEQNLRKISARFFCPCENEYLLACEKRFLKEFYNIWTRKEAYAKFTGLGIASFKSFDVCGYGVSHLHDPARTIRLRKKVADARIFDLSRQFREAVCLKLKTEGEYKAALAIYGKTQENKNPG